MKKVLFLKSFMLFAVLLGGISQAWGKYGRCEQYLFNDAHNILLYTKSEDLLIFDFFGQNNWAKEYIRLSQNNQLLNQMDIRLYELGLIKEKGGLCGPTCLANAYIAKDTLIAKTPSTYWIQNSPKLVKDLLDKYFRYTLNFKELPYMDPRDGTYAQYFVHEGSPILREMGISSRNLDVKSPAHMFHLLKSRDSLISGTVEFLEAPIAGSRHAILILGVDAVKQRLIVAEPNLPSEILVTPYTIVNGKLRFGLWPDIYAGAKKVELDEAYLLTIKD